MSLNIDTDEAEMKPREVSANEGDLMALQQTGRCVVRAFIDSQRGGARIFHVEDLYTGTVYSLEESPTTWRMYAVQEEGIAEIKAHMRESFARQKQILTVPDANLNCAVKNPEMITVAIGQIRFRLENLLDQLDEDMRKRFAFGESKEEAGVLVPCEVHEFLQLKARKYVGKEEHMRYTLGEPPDRTRDFSPHMYAALRFPRIKTISTGDFKLHIAAIHEEMERCRHFRYVIVNSYPRAIYMPADIYEPLCAASGITNRALRAIH